MSQNLLYFPLYRLVHAVASFFGAGVVDSLYALSLGSSALAAAVTYLAARQIRCHRAAAAIGALVLAFAPSIWFFAVAIEVHPPHLLAAACTAWWIARGHRRGTLGESALPYAAMLWLLAGTHPSGIF